MDDQDELSECWREWEWIHGFDEDVDDCGSGGGRGAAGGV